MPDQVIYAVGGTVQASGGIYISRDADEELLRLCQAGEFCYVLTARQTGKSSLMVATMERLAAEGLRSVKIDLGEVGTGLTAEQWYLGLIYLIAYQLDLKVNPIAWWNERNYIGPTQRLSQFLRQAVLEQVSEPVVISIDEIDSTLNLDFSDDFFAAIRACYNARASDPAFKRLSFVLLGVATPDDLISDPARTPFNIGRRVDLTDFTPEEAHPLAAGLGYDSATNERILDRILYWTGGHPYLTQKLCDLIATSEKQDWTSQKIDQLMEISFLEPRARIEEAHLNFVRKFIEERKNAAKLLELYLRVLLTATVKDNKQSPIHNALKLSGIVKVDDYGSLRIRNRIYQEVFNEDWAKASYGDAKERKMQLDENYDEAVALLNERDFRACLEKLDLIAQLDPTYDIDDIRQKALEGQEERTKKILLGHARQHFEAQEYQDVLEQLNDLTQRWPELRSQTEIAEMGTKALIRQSAIYLQGGNWEVRREAIRVLAKLITDDAEAVNELTSALQHPDHNTQRMVAEVFRQAIPALMTALDGDNLDMQQAAAKALGQLGDTRAVEPLIAALHEDRNSNVRQAAAEALGQLGDTRAVEPLIAALRHPIPVLYVQQAAAKALGQLGDTRATDPLVDTALRDRDLDVRQAATTALKRLRDARAVEPLIDALRDPDLDVQQAAAKTLGQLQDIQATKPLIDALQHQDLNMRQAAAEALGQLGDTWAVTSLMGAALRDPHLDVRRTAAKALGQLGDAQAVEHLVTALDDKDEDVRRAAIRTLGYIWKLKEVIDLGDEDAGVRRRATEALGRLGDGRAVRPLIAALRDRDKEVRRAVTKSLKWFDEAIPSLTTALGNDNRDIRQVAAEALGQLGNARAVEPLVAALQEELDWGMRRAVIRALGLIWGLKEVIDLGDEDADVRCRAAEALGRLGDERAVEPLIASRQDPDTKVRKEAIRALKRIGSPLLAYSSPSGHPRRDQ